MILFDLKQIVPSLLQGCFSVGLALLANSAIMIHDIDLNFSISWLLQGYFAGFGSHMAKFMHACTIHVKVQSFTRGSLF